MNRIMKLLLWFAMLSKRLYKQPTFLVLLVLIPALLFGYAAISDGESGVITVGLVGDAEDTVTGEIFTDLQRESAVMAFRIFKDEQEARTLLESGKLDAVWLFPEQLSEKIEAFAQKPSAANAFIKVLEREDNVALMLSREKLSGAIYPYLSQRIYVHFLRDLAPELSQLSDEQLLEYYQSTGLTMNLFEFTGVGNREAGYLLSPLRGLTGTLILLCALAAAMHYLRDEEKGTFAWVSSRWRLLPELGCYLVSTLHIAAACLVCLALCGLSGSIWAELLVLMMYSLCCSVFSMAMRQLLCSVRGLGTVLPLIIVASLVICPVFFDVGELRHAQYALPPTYYINAVYDHRYLVYMAAYTLLAAALVWLLRSAKSRLRQSHF